MNRTTDMNFTLFFGEDNTVSVFEFQLPLPGYCAAMNMKVSGTPEQVGKWITNRLNMAVRENAACNTLGELSEKQRAEYHALATDLSKISRSKSK